MGGRVMGILNAAGYVPPQDLRKQIVALDNEIAAMEKQITVLKMENMKLQGGNAPLQQEIERLREIVEHDLAEKQRVEKAAKAGGKQDRAKVQEDMLQVIAKHPEATAEQVAEAFGIGVEAAKYHLEELFGAGLLDDTWYGGDRHYRLKHEGRRYLNDRGLLK